MGVPLLRLLVVTTAVRLTALVGCVEKLTVNCVDEAELTVPMAPLLNVTVLFDGVVSNPVPVILMTVTSIFRFLVLSVTVGIAVKVISFPVPPT